MPVGVDIRAKQQKRNEELLLRFAQISLLDDAIAKIEGVQIQFAKA
jgi:hypothetical protein